jgi:hypothetical protein
MSTSDRTPKPPRPPCLSETALRELVRYALEMSYYRECFHAEHDHPERNISIEDVVYGLERDDWTLERHPEFDQEHNNWKYFIKTVDIEDELLIVLIRAVPEYRRFEVITRW